MIKTKEYEKGPSSTPHLFTYYSDRSNSYPDAF